MAFDDVDGRGHFLGNTQEYRGILSRDALQLVATLGLYRFWVSTDVRRYLWSRTEIAGEQLEYTGDPFELLVGFLVLVVVLGPLVAIFSILAALTGEIGIAVISAYLPLVLLVPLGLLALYQARRYRVNHTIFRGLRFHQTGSAWIYALLTGFWFILNVVSYGLTYPWARASLERYKMRHTFYGDVQGSFQGSGAALLKDGFVLWLIVCGPALVLYWGDVGTRRIESLDTTYGRLAAAAWLAVAGLAVYPLFRARVLRWRIAGMRFGTLSLASDFPTWNLYKAYLKFFGFLVALAVGVTFAAFQIQANVVPALPLGRSVVIEFIGVVALAIAYFAVATAAAFAYQGTVRFETWRLIADSLVLKGLDQLDRARVHPGHAARHSGRIGAALNLGGI